MVGGKLPPFDDDVWELYDGGGDYSQAHDRVAERPEMLAKLQRLWLIEATKDTSVNNCVFWCVA
jgi:arylsulfatase